MVTSVAVAEKIGCHAGGDGASAGVEDGDGKAGAIGAEGGATTAAAGGANGRGVDDDAQLAVSHPSELATSDAYPVLIWTCQA
jgi:hypothetical protein